MALVFVVVSPFSGALTNRFGSRLTTAGGVGVIGCGWLLVGLTAHMPTVLGTEAGLLLTGIGMGVATGPLNSVAVGLSAAAGVAAMDLVLSIVIQLVADAMLGIGTTGVAAAAAN
ncbi:MAG TPA: MFS transporter, partial [Alphaproteobacteria bacterium]|nr:MFS transporter [Alphaproteobacteria bacterium]